MEIVSYHVIKIMSMTQIVSLDTFRKVVITIPPVNGMRETNYSKTCVKWPPKNIQNKDLYDKL